ncbi:MAG TPA: hypothetical protein VG389_14020, partial [Myxococcota bacterium]|nr:hypothetical protein [Myxococcota bacterium]
MSFARLAAVGGLILAWSWPVPALALAPSRPAKAAVMKKATKRPLKKKRRAPAAKPRPARPRTAAAPAHGDAGAMVFTAAETTPDRPAAALPPPPPPAGSSPLPEPPAAAWIGAGSGGDDALAAAAAGRPHAPDRVTLDVAAGWAVWQERFLADGAAAPTRLTFGQATVEVAGALRIAAGLGVDARIGVGYMRADEFTWLDGTTAVRAATASWRLDLGLSYALTLHEPTATAAALR